MKTHGETQKIDTTLGELITALSDAAMEICLQERQAYVLTALALDSIFEKNRAADYGPALRDHAEHG